MCSQAFIFRRLDELETILKTTHQMCLNAAADEEGYLEIREQMIHQVRPFAEMVCLMLRELTSMVKDDAERKVVSDRITALLDADVEKARLLHQDKMARLPPEVKEFMDLLFRIEDEIDKEDIDSSMN